MGVYCQSLSLHTHSNNKQEASFLSLLEKKTEGDCLRKNNAKKKNSLGQARVKGKLGPGCT